MKDRGDCRENLGSSLYHTGGVISTSTHAGRREQTHPFNGILLLLQHPLLFFKGLAFNHIYTYVSVFGYVRVNADFPGVL